MLEQAILSAKTIFYEDRNRYGYAIYSVKLSGSSLILVSPGIYETSDETFVAATEEVHRLYGRMNQYAQRKSAGGFSYAS